MPDTQETNISSFLIRFIDVNKLEGQSTGAFRGVVRHIQTGDELAFTRWKEAVDFMQRFFPFEDGYSESLPEA
ncbi:MAG: hypothetical protein P8X64_09885 [Anaerolineales bacterium]